MKKNFWLDVLLFVSGLICIVTRIMLEIWHGDWLKDATKKIFRSR